MAKNTLSSPVEYHESDVYEGKCTNCGTMNTKWDYYKEMKAGVFGEMYCSFCRAKTPHTNVKKVSN